MLNEVLAILAAEGWFDPSREFERTIYFTHGAAHSMLLSRGGRPDIFVKFSDRLNLAPEAERCGAAEKRFRGLVPGFVGHARRGALEVLVTRAVSFQSMNPELMRSWRHTSVVQAGLEDYFSRMRAAARPGTDPRTWLEEYHAYFEHHPFRYSASQSLQVMLSALRGFPSQDQHGDFVVNNLGLAQNHKLAVFDWEDYGAVDVPGLDLFTLEISLRDALGQSIDEGSGRAPPPRTLGLDVERMCRAMQLPRSVYDELRLSYAFVFRFLKRNYSAESRSRVDRLLEQLIAGSRATA